MMNVHHDEYTKMKAYNMFYLYSDSPKGKHEKVW